MTALRRLALVLLILPFVFGCPERWDPNDPPGVSHGSDSTGGERPVEESSPSTVVDSMPRDEVHGGELADGDHVLAVDGTLYDEFAFSAVEGASVVITMESAELDPYLHLLGPDGRQLAHRGTPPGEGGNVAEIIVIAPVTGEYSIYANALEPAMRGAYHLRVVVEPPPRRSETAR